MLVTFGQRLVKDAEEFCGEKFKDRICNEKGNNDMGMSDTLQFHLVFKWKRTQSII